MRGIALTGPMLAGKTTIAKSLIAAGLEPVWFSDALKELAAVGLNAIGEYTGYFGKTLIDAQVISQNKTHYRTFLQELGSLIGFDTDPYFIYRSLLDAKREPVVLDCIRSDAQAEAVHDTGLLVVNVTVSQVVQDQRANQLGIPYDRMIEMRRHPIEHGISPDFIDLELNGAGLIGSNVLKVLDLLKEVAA